MCLFKILKDSVKLEKAVLEERGLYPIFFGQVCDRILKSLLRFLLSFLLFVLLLLYALNNQIFHQVSHRP